MCGQLQNRRFCLQCLLLLLLVTPAICQSAPDDPELYKLRVQAHWWIAKPGGSLQGNLDRISFDRDLGFRDYNTFFGMFDWKFARKHHFFVTVAPNRSSSTRTISRQFEFRGQTFFVGEQLRSEVKSFIVSPGYEYDFIRRPRGHFGVSVQISLFDTTATISTVGGVAGPGGVTTTSRKASGSILAPLPIAGPTFRYYLIPRRLYVDGAINGMYFFGYGNFVSGNGTMGVALGKHFSIRGGYLLGGRTIITGTDQRLGLRLTQKGPVVGFETKW
jgi:hypothetical protein